MYQAHMPLRGLPVALVLVSNGSVALAKQVALMPTILEENDGKPYAHWFKDSVVFHADEDTDELEYNRAYDYKAFPAFKAWLVNEKLELET